MAMGPPAPVLSLPTLGHRVSRHSHEDAGVQSTNDDAQISKL